MANMRASCIVPILFLFYALWKHFQWKQKQTKIKQKQKGKIWRRIQRSATRIKWKVIQKWKICNEEIFSGKQFFCNISKRAGTYKNGVGIRSWTICIRTQTLSTRKKIWNLSVHHPSFKKKNAYISAKQNLAHQSIRIPYNVYGLRITKNGEWRTSNKMHTICTVNGCCAFWNQNEINFHV